MQDNRRTNLPTCILCPSLSYAKRTTFYTLPCQCQAAPSLQHKAYAVIANELKRVSQSSTRQYRLLDPRDAFSTHNGKDSNAHNMFSTNRPTGACGATVTCICPRAFRVPVLLMRSAPLFTHCRVSVRRHLRCNTQQ